MKNVNWNVSRREMLSRTGLGMASLGLGMLVGDGAEASSALAASPPHFAPRAKRVIHLFLNGGLSHVDTFDYKPALAKYAGKPLPGVDPIVMTVRGMRCPRRSSSVPAVVTA